LQGTQSTNSADDLTFTAGAAGATAGGTAGSAGDTVVVGSNATINVTDELVGSATKYNNLDLGTVSGQNVTINASTFHGTLKVGVVSSGAGNVAIYGGSAADTLTGGTGADVISGGAGSDVITGGTGLDVLTGGAGADTFVYAASTTGTPSSTVFDEITDYGLGSDIIDFGATLLVKVATSGSTSVATTALITNGIASFNAADDTLAEKIAAVNAGLVAGSEADGQFAIFTHGSDTYLYILQDDAGDAVTAADVLIKLTGVAGATATVTSGDLVIS
jgi:Ca2+-binding RTX toxin-like protein